jgi:hypothetical protein
MRGGRQAFGWGFNMSLLEPQLSADAVSNGSRQSIASESSDLLSQLVFIKQSFIFLRLERTNLVGERE